MEIKEMINDDAETKEIRSTQYNYCALTAMLSRSAAKRDIYIFVVQKILQNYNFSPGQEVSMTTNKELKDKRLTPNSSCGIDHKKL